MLYKDSDVVSNDEMKDNFHIIKRHVPIFKEKFDKVLLETKGDVPSSKLDILIKEALKEGDLNFVEQRILNGFYESWMAIFMMVGDPKQSLEMLIRMIGV